MIWNRFRPQSSSPQPLESAEEKKKFCLDLEKQEKLAYQIRSSLKKIAQTERELRETQKTYESEQAKLYLELLDIVDSLDSLIENLPVEEDPNPQLLKRLPRLLGSIQRRLLRSLELREVLPIESDAQEFDSRFCQVIEKEERPDLKHGTILKVLRPGFTYRNVLLRPQEVIISEQK
jgi:molecular chaperone GrpE (heat shock protein)